MGHIVRSRARRHALSICLALVACAAVVPAAPAQTLPPGFQVEVIGEGMPGSVAVDWAPDGRMFVATVRDAYVHVLNPGRTTPSATINLPGAIYGMALDTDFARNGFVYVLRTQGGTANCYDVNRVTSSCSQRLSRYVVGPDNRLVGGEKVLVGGMTTCKWPPVEEDCMSSAGVHDLGTVLSDPRDGTIWFGNGDNGDTGHRPETFTVQSDFTLNGKILHVDREGRGLPNHPFCKSVTDLNRPCTKVWAKGFRNPFRFNWRPDGKLLVGDVGWNSREEVDLVDTTTGGGNYGWPCYEGALRTPSFRDDDLCKDMYRLEGTSQAAILPNYEYAHAGGDWSVTGGPTYRGGTYPADFVGDAFIADYGQGWIKRLEFDSAGRIVAVKNFVPNAGPVVDLKLAPNGDLVYVTIDGKVRQIRSTSRNRVPVARASATPTSGQPPLAVQFSSAGSSDPDGDPLSFDWDFGDGTARSTAANPRHSYANAGTYTARLTVRDPSGATASTTVLIEVGNTGPTVSISGPATYRGGQALSFRGSATDKEDGPVPASRLKWEFELIHNTHTHLGEQASGTATFGFTTVDDHDADSYYLVRLTATDSGGASATKTVEVRPETVELRLTSSPPGAPLVYDGFDVVAPLIKQSAIGLRTTVSAAERFTRNGVSYRFTGWSDGGQRLHDIVIPDRPLALEARYEPESGQPEQTVVEAEGMTGVTRTGAIRALPRQDASGGAVAYMLRASALSTTIETPSAGRLSVFAEGQQCSGAPVMVAEVDGRQVLKARVPAHGLQRFSVPLELPAGRHTLRVLYQADTRTTSCDRNLIVDRIVFSAAESDIQPTSALLEHLEAETMSGITATGPAQAVSDTAASAGAAARFLRNAKIQRRQRIPATQYVVVRADGRSCGGDAIMVIRRNGMEVFRSMVPAGGYADHVFPIRLPAGDFTYQAAFINDRRTTTCDRDLFVDRISLYAEDGGTGGRTAAAWTAWPARAL